MSIICLVKRSFERKRKAVISRHSKCDILCVGRRMFSKLSIECDSEIIIVDCIAVIAIMII